MYNHKEINKIVKSVVEIVPEAEVYLFGSFAKGEEHDDSDYDFYIVIPDDNYMPELETTWAIDKAIGERTRGIDMIVGKQSKFNRRKQFYSIEKEVATEGIKLYG